MENIDLKRMYFSEIVAKDIGVEEAIMFSNIYYWVNLNKRNNSQRHYHKDKYWMFNTVSDFKEQYSFWTVATVRRILNNLERKSYIETGRFNQHRYDRTKWYTITPKAFSIAEQDTRFVEAVNSFSQE